MICCRGEGCGGPAARIPWESNIRRVSAIWLEKLEQLMISYNLPIIIATKYSKPLPTKPTEKVACHFPKMPQYMLFLKEKSTNHQFNGFPPPRCASAADFRSLRFVVLGGESGFSKWKLTISTASVFYLAFCRETMQLFGYCTAETKLSWTTFRLKKIIETWILGLSQHFAFCPHDPRDSEGKIHPTHWGPRGKKFSHDIGEAAQANHLNHRGEKTHATLPQVDAAWLSCPQKNLWKEPLVLKKISFQSNLLIKIGSPQRS